MDRRLIAETVSSLTAGFAAFGALSQEDLREMELREVLNSSPIIALDLPVGTIWVVSGDPAAMLAAIEAGELSVADAAKRCVKLQL